MQPRLHHNNRFLHRVANVPWPRAWRRRLPDERDEVGDLVGLSEHRTVSQNARRDMPARVAPNAGWWRPLPSGTSASLSRRRAERYGARVRDGFVVVRAQPIRRSVALARGSPTLCPMEPGPSEHTEGLLNARNVGGVVKVGDTVRRPAGPWTPTVHALLAYLHQSGFDFAPRPLGIDEAGREILTYIEGETQVTPVADRVWFDALPEAARRLRQLHDLTADFVPPDGAIWREPFSSPSRLEGSSHTSDDKATVICHGDWGKHNAVFRHGRLVGMIDWDYARPEHRLYDIGWCALEWCPVLPPEIVGPDLPDPVEWQPARLRQLCDAYGLEDRSGVLDAVWSCLETFVEWLEAGAAAGDPPREQRVKAGEAAHHRRRLEYLINAQVEFAAALR